MSYVIKRLNDLSELKLELTLHPEHIKHYSKYSCFIGSHESMEYIQKLLKK